MAKIGLHVSTGDGWNKGFVEYGWLEVKNNEIPSDPIYHWFNSLKNMC